MKPRIQSTIFLATLLLGTIAFLLGCSSRSGMQRSEDATTTMQTVAEEINHIATKLDITGMSLDDLTQSGQSDVKKAFASFSDNVSKMGDFQKRFNKHADEMSARGKEYFAEWKKQGDAYTNPRIRELSEERRTELGGIYDRIAEASVGVKGEFQTYMTDMQEIQTYLSNDLTPRGLEAILPSTHKVVRDGDRLRNALNHVRTAVDRASQAMIQGGIN